MATHIWSHETHYAPALQPVAVTTPSVVLLALGRIIFGGYFLYNGIHHFVALQQLSGFAAANGVPFPETAVAGTGLLMLLGGLSLVTGIWTHAGALLIALFLIGVTPVMHAFWNDPPGPERMNNLGHFLSNVGLLGGACFAAALPDGWPHGTAPREIVSSADDMSGPTQAGGPADEW